MKFFGFIACIIFTYSLSSCNSNANEIVLTQSGDTTFVEGNSLVFATFAFRQYSAKGLVPLENSPFDGYAMARTDFGPDSTKVKKMNTFLISTRASKSIINAGEKQSFVFVITDSGDIISFDSYQNNEEKIASLMGVKYKKQEPVQSIEEQERIQQEEAQRQKEIIIKQEKAVQDSVKNTPPSTMQSIKPTKE